jgi:hypothetical protein
MPRAEKPWSQMDNDGPNNVWVFLLCDLPDGHHSHRGRILKKTHEQEGTALAV